MSPKTVGKLVKIRISFGSLVLQVLELFKCFLGAFLGLPRPSWVALDLKSRAHLKKVEGSSRTPGESQDKRKEAQEGFQRPKGVPPSLF